MDEIAKRMAELAEKYGPSVIEATRGAVRVEAYSTLMGSVIAAGFSTAFILAGRWVFKRKGEDSADAAMLKFLGGLLIAVGLIPAAIALWAWIDPWTWVAITNPDLWIAKKVFKL